MVQFRTTPAKTKCYNEYIKNRGTQNLWKTRIRVATYRQGEMPERIYYEDHCEEECSQVH